MSGRGGIYEGPDGSKLHGDGREVKAMSQSNKERVIAELLNGETSVYVKCALNLGFDAGYITAKEDAAKFMTDRGCSSWAAAIRKLEPKP